jgi:hypothetical protein
MNGQNGKNGADGMAGAPGKFGKTTCLSTQLAVVMNISDAIHHMHQLMLIRLRTVMAWQILAISLVILNILVA